MISPIELGLMIQTTIYFAIVSDADSYAWSCAASEFINEACDVAVFSTSGAPQQTYYYCKQTTIKPLLVPQETDPSCGETKAMVDLYKASDSECTSSCFLFSTVESNDLCACGNVSYDVTPSQFGTELVARDLCAENFLYLMIGLLIILLAWLVRIMLQGTWTYFRFYSESLNTKRQTGAVTEGAIADVYGIVTSHWNYRGKYFFFVIDVLCGVGLFIIMILVASTPFSFCYQSKLYTSIALATLAFCNIVTVIPYIVIWRFIEQRIYLPLRTSMTMTTTAQ